MSENEREEAKLRLRALLHEMEAWRLRLAATAIKATASMREFADAWNEAFAEELAEHPDMAELNVQLDARYSFDGK